MELSANQDTHYDTSSVLVRDRFAYWREAVCDSFVQLGCETEQQHDFTGRLDIVRHSVLSVSHVTGNAHTVERRPSDIGRSKDPYFLLSLQTEKTAHISQFGNSSILHPGDMAIYTSSDPYQLHLTQGFSQTVVQLPKDRLLQRLPNAHKYAAQRIDGKSGIGRLVRENIHAFSDLVISADPTLQSLIQDMLIDLIATGLASIKGSNAELTSPEEHILLRTKSYIRTNISDPDMDRNTVAAATGMSVRRLNDIFSKEHHSLSSYIRDVRIEAVKNQLVDPRFAALSISEIAMRNGFNNFQHFSALFKGKTTQSPRAFRLLRC